MGRPIGSSRWPGAGGGSRGGLHRLNALAVLLLAALRCFVERTCSLPPLALEDFTGLTLLALLLAERLDLELKAPELQGLVLALDLLELAELVPAGQLGALEDEFELHRAAEGSDRDGILGILDRFRGVHQVKDTFGRGHGLLQDARFLGQILQGPEEFSYVGEEGDQIRRNVIDLW